jgi:hypothetical protein
MRKLLYLLLTGAALWSGYWFAGASAIRQGAEDWFAGAAEQGLLAEKSMLEIDGFPNRFDLTVTDLRLSDPQGGTGWQAPFAQVFAMTWKPWHIIAALPPEQVVTLPDQEIVLRSEAMRASLRARPALDLPLAALVLESGPFVAGSTRGWTVGAAKAVASISADEEVPGAGDTANGYVLASDVTVFAPDPAFLTAVNAVSIPDLPAPDFPDRVERLSAVIHLTTSAPLDRHAGKTRPHLTKIDFRAVDLAWGELALSAKGVVEADDKGYAAGKVTLAVTNWDRLPALLVAAGVVKPELAPTIANGLRALASQTPDLKVLSLNLVLEEGRMSFGPFPLGPAPLMVPPSG